MKRVDEAIRIKYADGAKEREATEAPMCGATAMGRGKRERYDNSWSRARRSRWIDAMHDGEPAVCMGVYGPWTLEWGNNGVRDSAIHLPPPPLVTSKLTYPRTTSSMYDGRRVMPFAGPMVEGPGKKRMSQAACSARRGRKSMGRIRASPSASGGSGRKRMSAGTTLEAAAGSAMTHYPPTGPVKLLPRIVQESPKFFRPCPKSGYFRRDFGTEKKSATSKLARRGRARRGGGEGERFLAVWCTSSADSRTLAPRAPALQRAALSGASGRLRFEPMNYVRSYYSLVFTSVYFWAPARVYLPDDEFHAECMSATSLRPDSTELTATRISNVKWLCICQFKPFEFLSSAQKPSSIQTLCHNEFRARRGVKIPKGIAKKIQIYPLSSFSVRFYHLLDLMSATIPLRLQTYRR
ncbi:hypothetical protein C8J57DRAFT_1257873 [Mycena rebaudengoi]|nr:hypothetical protein C8J57DRAFT_1257873 [Mycena rebaudengoi]